MRRISHVVVGNPVPDEDLVEAADLVTGWAERLEAVAVPEKILRQFPDPDGHPQDFFPTSPMTGVASPVSPPAEVWAVVGAEGYREIRGRARFGYQYEGPPTCVHGGVIAELFDELLGLANLTAKSTRDYRDAHDPIPPADPAAGPLELVAATPGVSGGRSSPGAASSTTGCSRPRPRASSSRSCRTACVASWRATPPRPTHP